MRGYKLASPCGSRWLLTTRFRASDLSLHDRVFPGVSSCWYTQLWCAQPRINTDFYYQETFRLFLKLSTNSRALNHLTLLCILFRKINQNKQESGLQSSPILQNKKDHRGAERSFLLQSAMSFLNHSNSYLCCGSHLLYRQLIPK